LQQCNVANSRMLVKLLCVELHTSSKYTVCNLPWHKSYQIYAFKSLFLHIKYNSNMAAYDNDVTARHA